MKTLKLNFLSLVSLVLLWACEPDALYEPVNNNISLEQLLAAYELWCVDLNSTRGNGQTPFVEMAFTVSFLNGTLFANNNLVGLGDRGNGFGISVGSYNTSGVTLDVYHNIDGLQRFEVFQKNARSIELYNPSNNTSYFLNGYQRNDFDYDKVFFNNIDYFLQEYKAWEKTLTNAEGEETSFDSENYLYFFNENGSNLFKSSEDESVGNVDNIYWDYTGAFSVNTAVGIDETKKITLNYDFYDNEQFDLTIINDQLIRLYHHDSGKNYEFRGINNIVYMKSREGSGDEFSAMKVRPQTTKRELNLRANKQSSSWVNYAKP